MKNADSHSEEECKLVVQQRAAKQSEHTQIMHKGYTIVSKKFKSAQGSVYFVQDKETQEVFVLKLYKQEDLKSYTKEKNILIKLRDAGKCHLGFPLLISIMEGPNHSELLMEALGANLK
jgi:virulence-associated protein VapD